MDLRDAPPHLLYDFGYSMLVRMTRSTEEEMEAKEKLDDAFRDMAFTEETGLPAIAQAFAPADGFMGMPEGF